MNRILPLVALTAAGLLVSPAAADEQKKTAPLEIGSHRQLFIDDFVIDRMEAVRRNIHQADTYPGNPVLQPEMPWEGKKVLYSDGGQGPGKGLQRVLPLLGSPMVLLYGGVERHPESGRLRMWYLTAESSPKKDSRLYRGEVNWYCCLGESDDGIRWTRPKLGLVGDLSGSKENNIVVSTLAHSGLHVYVNPVRDPNPKDPQKRYRAIYHAHVPDVRPSGSYDAWSPDGIHWTSAEKPLFPKLGDTSSLMYDKYRDRWVFLARPKYDQISRVVTFSKDFETWTEPKFIFKADAAKREDFYNMTGFCYEGLYLGTVVVFWEEAGRYALEPHLVISRDCESWTWVDRQGAFIPHGPRGSWEEFNTQVAAGDPIRMGDRLYFYYSSRTYPHRPYYARSNPEIIPKQLVKTHSCIGLATLRLDGFASLEDYWRGGTVTTKPLVPAGSKLHVNAACEHGQLRVEVLDSSGNPIPGYTADQCRPIQADSVDIAVAWQDHDTLEGLAGKPVRFKFHLKKTKLYSFWID